MRIGRWVSPKRASNSWRAEAEPGATGTMQGRHLPGLAIATIAATLTVSVAAQNPPAPPTTVDFTRDIQPILQASCYECHGTKKTKARLRLDSAAGIVKNVLVEPGKAVEKGTLLIDFQ